MILPIVAYGSQVLRAKTEEIEASYPDLKELLEDMYETMEASNGIGLAAPQVGKAIRLFLVDATAIEDVEPSGFRQTFINPIIEEEEGKEWPFQEGCLSIPKIRENVSRKPDIVVSYYDENWVLHEEKFSGYAARIIQHEYDHIEGVLFTDYLSPLKRKLLKKKLNNITNGLIEIEYKMSFPKNS